MVSTPGVDMLGYAPLTGVEKAGVDFKARGQGNAIMRAVVEICRFDRRIAGDQPFALSA